jgi:hypothetical protein
MSERFKLCTRCGSEYVWTMESCIDCGGPLTEVDPRMTTPPRGRREPSPLTDLRPAHVFTAADEPLVLRQEELPYVQALAERLRAAGIPYEVFAPDDCRGGCSTKYSVLVGTADFVAAAAVDRQVLAELVPDAETFVDLDTAGCPACGTPRIPGAVDCADCGLSIDFGPADLEELAQDEDEEREREQLGVG